MGVSRFGSYFTGVLPIRVCVCVCVRSGFRLISPCLVRRAHPLLGAVHRRAPHARPLRRRSCMPARVPIRRASARFGYYLILVGQSEL